MDTTDPIKAADVVILKQEIEKLFELLTTREGFVLRQRYGLDDDVDKTLEEVAKLLGVTRERVRQIQAKALRKLINTSTNMELKEFIQ